MSSLRRQSLVSLKFFAEDQPFLVGDLSLRLRLLGADEDSVADAQLWLDDYQSTDGGEHDWLIETSICEQASGLYGKQWQTGGIQLDNLVIDHSEKRVSFNVLESMYRLGRWGVPFAFHYSVLGGLVAICRGQSQRRVVHAAAVALNEDEAIMITGPSGAGKSSLSRVLGPKQLGDEVILTSVEDDGIYVAGTPVPGELRAVDTRKRKLRAILIPGVQNSDQMMLRQLKGAEAPSRLVHTTVRLQGDDFNPDLEWFDAVLSATPMYEVSWSKMRDFPRRLLGEVLA